MSLPFLGVYKLLHPEVIKEFLVQADRLEIRVVHQLNLGQALSLGEVTHGVIIRGEHGDRAFLHVRVFGARLRA